MKKRVPIKKLWYRMSGFVPERLPSTPEQFDRFCEKICVAVGVPLNSSYQEAIATTIMHLQPSQHRCTREFFTRQVLKAISNQVAFLFLDQKREARRQELEKKKLEENPENCA